MGIEWESFLKAKCLRIRGKGQGFQVWYSSQELQMSEGTLTITVMGNYQATTTKLTVMK